MKIELEDIPTILIELGAMKKVNEDSYQSSFCMCCGTNYSPVINTVPKDPTGSSVYNYKGRIKGSVWDTTVVPSEDRAEHIIIPDEAVEFLIEWNDK